MSDKKTVGRPQGRNNGVLYISISEAERAIFNEKFEKYKKDNGLLKLKMSQFAGMCLMKGLNEIKY